MAQNLALGNLSQVTIMGIYRVYGVFRVFRA